MNNTGKLVALMAAGAMVAGCSSLSGTRAKKDSELNTRVANLEGQVTALNQRVEELSQGEAPAQTGDEVSSSQAAPAARSAQKLTTRQVQRALASAGFYKGTVDGKEGPQTKRAIREFQQAQGLKVDGVVGSSTRQALAKYLEGPKE